MSKINFSVQDIKDTLSFGSLDKAIGNNLMAIDHDNIKTYNPMARTLQGLVFWVRPGLNMSGGNIGQSRVLAPLLSGANLSVQSYIRHMLDPRVLGGFTPPRGSGNAGSDNGYIDNKQAFIPIMTNSVKTVSGWPDLVSKQFVDEAGLQGQTFTMVDSECSMRENVEITATFNNSAGEPILNMMNVWIQYMGLVFNGKLTPYPDYVVQNELDYNTRIFRVLLDKTGRYVTKIAATGPGIPLALGIGAGFDYTSDTPYNEQNETLDVRFQFHGVEYNDPILVIDFNTVVSIFNPDMTAKAGMTKIPFGLRRYYKHMGYPWIDPNTMEYQVWVPDDQVFERTNLLLRTGMAPEITDMVNAAKRSK
jgi:hypothetical protein